MHDAYYGVVLAGSVAAVWGTGVGTGRVVSIAALCALVPWYGLAGRRARRASPVPARTVCYQLGVLGLLVTAQVATLTSSVVLFALVPQSFMLLPIGWACSRWHCSTWCWWLRRSTRRASALSGRRWGHLMSAQRDRAEVRWHPG